MTEGITLAALIFMSALGGWDAFWQHMADQARRGPLETPVMDQAQGLVLTRGEVMSDQGPNMRRLRIGDVGVSGTMRGQNWSWQSGEVVVQVDPARPDRVTVLFPSPQQLDMTGPMGNGRLTLWALNLAATLDLAPDGRVVATRLAGEGLTLTGIGLDSRADAIEIKLGEDDEQRRLLDIVLRMVELPAAARVGDPVGRVVQHAHLDAWISGLHPVPARDVNEWQRANGTIGIPRLEIEWGGLSMSGTGRAGLDTEYRPQGRVAMTLLGVRGAVEAAESTGMIDLATRDQVLQGLDQLAALRGEDGDFEVSVEMSMGGGRLSWSGLPIMALPSFAAPLAARANPD